jgi:DNA-binding transcriptional LysR family regulator
MNIENIEAFIYVHHLGSFHRAAEVLYLTQPSVTARIQSLEKELNAKLFHRNGRNITLTEQGKHFLPYAYHILKTYKEAKDHLKQEIFDQSELNLACSLSVSIYIIPELLATFRKQFPNVSVRVFTGHSSQVLNMVTNKKVDFGIARSVSNSLVENDLWYVDPISLVVPPNHPFVNNQRSITMEEVSLEPLIFFDHGSIDWLMINGVFESKKLKPNVIMEVDNIESAKKMVMNGIGISFLPELCLKNELRNGELCTVPISPTLNMARNIEIIYLKEHQPRFLDFFMNFKPFKMETQMQETYG